MYVFYMFVLCISIYTLMLCMFAAGQERDGVSQSGGATADVQRTKRT
jgi:hypothetical protein